MTLRTYDEIRHLRNEKGTGDKAHPAIASGIVTGNAPVSLSKDVFERRRLAGSGLLILDAGFAQFFVTNPSIIVKTLRNTNLVAPRCFKMIKKCHFRLACFAHKAAFWLSFPCR